MAASNAYFSPAPFNHSIGAITAGSKRVIIGVRQVRRDRNAGSAMSLKHSIRAGKMAY